MPLPRPWTPDLVERDAVIEHQPAGLQDARGFFRSSADSCGCRHARTCRCWQSCRRACPAAARGSRAIRPARDPARPTLADLFAHVVVLVLRQRDTGRLDAVLPAPRGKSGRPNRIRCRGTPRRDAASACGRCGRASAPAPDRACRLTIAKIGARIDHALVEPQRGRTRWRRRSDAGCWAGCRDAGATTASPGSRTRSRPCCTLPTSASAMSSDALRAAGEVEIVADVGSRKSPKLGRRQRPQSVPRARVDVDFGRLRQRDAPAVGQDQRHGDVATVVAVGDDSGERVLHGRWSAERRAG